MVAPDGDLWALDPAGEKLLPLAPAALWREGDWWFLNGWEDPRHVEYLSYASGRMFQTGGRGHRDLFDPPPSRLLARSTRPSRWRSPAGPSGSWRLT